jgi:hypothetical protein
MATIVTLLPFKSLVKNETENEDIYKIYGLDAPVIIKTTAKILQTFEYLLLYTIKNYVTLECNEPKIIFTLENFKRELIVFNLDMKNFIDQNTNLQRHESQLLQFLPHNFDNLLDCLDVILKVLEQNDCEIALAHEINYSIEKPVLDLNNLSIKERFVAIWNAVDDKVFYRPSLSFYQNLVPILFQFYFLLKHSADEDVIANKIGVFIKHWIHVNCDPNVPNIYKYIESFILGKYGSREKLYYALKNIWIDNTAFHLPKLFERIPSLNFETLYNKCKKDINLQQQMTQNKDKLLNWYLEIDKLLLSEIECKHLSGMDVFVREMNWYIIYTTIREANEKQKFNSHINWMIVYTIRKFQAITKKDICTLCQDIINIIFTSQGEAINNDIVLDWLKNKNIIILFNIINDQLKISQSHNSESAQPITAINQKRRR